LVIIYFYKAILNKNTPLHFRTFDDSLIKKHVGSEPEKKKDSMEIDKRKISSEENSGNSGMRSSSEQIQNFLMDSNQGDELEYCGKLKKISYLGGGGEARVIFKIFYFL
jgi:hypothetical protein